MIPTIVYLNGEFLPEGKAVIPVTDRGFLFGDGVFTTIRIQEGHPEFLEQHLQKLVQDCELLGIVPPRISEENIHDLIRKNGADSGVWRLKIILSGGNSPELNLSKRSLGQLLMTLKPYGVSSSPCRLTVYPYPYNTPFGGIKSLAYLDRLRIADYAKKHGFDDALVLNYEGIMLETSIANLFWKVGQEVFYPDTSLSLYNGVTLQVLLGAMEKMDLKSWPVKAKLEEIPRDAQVFMCNSMKGFVPVISIGTKEFKRDLEFESNLRELSFGI